jgi:choline-sulfatase
MRHTARTSNPAAPGPLAAAIALSVALTIGAYGQSRVTGGTQPGHSQAASTQGRSDRVNVVIFLIDTLRADRLGVYGYDRRPTSPHIDALAREAVVFEQAYAPSPWTLPTVVSLLTSTLPCEHGTLHDGQRLSDSLEPLAERFKRLDYGTLSLYANAFASPNFGMDRGYDFERAGVETEGKRVGRVLNRQPQRPFFLYIHNTEPHTPHRFAPPHTDGFRDVPPETREKIRRRYLTYRRLTRIDHAENRPVGFTDNTEEQDEQMAALTAMLDDYTELYDASVRLADTHVGSVIDALQQCHLWDNTLFIVLADHGEEFNEHGGWLHDQSAYEELMAVPLIIRFPHGQYAGRRIQSVVSLIDVLPTIFAYLEAPDGARGARGRDLMPLIRGDQPDRTDDFIIPGMRVNRKKYYRPWKDSRGDTNVVVRRGKWKGIWNAEPDELELYNLAIDPGEQHEVSAANPDLALAMRLMARLSFKDCRKNRAEPPKPSDKPEGETLENLRALGYVD